MDREIPPVQTVLGCTVVLFDWGQEQILKMLSGKGQVGWYLIWVFT